MTNKQRCYELMGKGYLTPLEELELIQKSGCSIGNHYIGFNHIEQALTRLNYYDEMLSFSNGSLMAGFDNKNGKQIVAMPLEEYNDYEKQSRVLNLIKESNLSSLDVIIDLETYNDYLIYYTVKTNLRMKPEKKYSEEEFNLLKEMLKHES